MSTAKDAKRVEIDQIKEDIKSSGSLVIVDYRGITAGKDTELRNKFRAEGCKYAVLKNRLVKIALNELGITELDNLLEETNAFAFGFKDVIAPARISNDAQEAKILKLKGGRLGDEILDAEGVAKIAKIPSKEVLVAQFLGLLKEPVARFARVIQAIADKQQ